jgi:3-hydroxyisobutyrate dehydrogenase
MEQRIAVIGIGQMGGSIAERLTASGLDVVGYDIDASVRRSREAEGIKVAGTVDDAIAGRGVIMTSLPDPAAVRAAWLGDSGIVNRAAPGTVCIELSTVDPGTMREVAAAAAAERLQVVDCPVSGSPSEALAGKLTLIVAGDRGVVDSIEPLLVLVGDTWRYTGGIGTAKVVKLVNNMMSMGNVLIASEAFALGVAAGVSPETLYDVLSVSGGRSHHFTKRFPNALAGDFRPGFKMELGEKDLALAIQLGRTVKLPTPAASMVRELFALAIAEGFEGQDIVALLEMYRRWAVSSAPAPQPGQGAGTRSTARSNDP